MILNDLLIKFLKWINTPPNQSDLFFVHIREMKQQLFPCKHKWETLKYKKFHRKCVICGEYQMLVYHEYGSIRTEWISYDK